MVEGGVVGRACVVVPYEPRMRAEVAGVLGRAFADDPLYRAFWPDDLVRPRRVEAFCGAETEMTARAGRVDVALDAGTGRVLGAALWGVPGGYPFPVRVSGPPMLRLVPRFGPRAVRLLPEMKVVDRAHPREPHWYLLTLGVDPPHQGRRIGETLLRTVARRADGAGVPVYLETFNPSNPAYYRRLGFEDVRTVTPRRLPPFWTMQRGPRAPT